MLSESVTEKYLSLQFSQFGPVSHVAIDRTRGHGLVFYDQVSFICNILSIYISFYLILFYIISFVYSF